MARSFLILHGYGGSGPEHWQTWLAERLRGAGETVAYPDLPAPEEPRLEAWRDVLDRTLVDGATVLAHSLSCLLWLHACPEAGARAARVLLVAPPSKAGAPPGLDPWFTAPLDPAALRAETRLVCAPYDEYCPEGAARTYAEPLGIPVDELPGAGHVNPETGYGPWPAVEAWCYGASAIASSRIAPG